MTEVLSIRSYDHQEDASLNERVAACYASVFAGPPWNESWSREAALAVLQEQRGLTNVIAFEGEKVVGFAFARVERISDLERKLGIPFADEVSARQYGPHGPGFVLYQADLGVLGAYRERGIGKRLFRARLDASPCEESYQVVRARVSPEPSVTYLWYTEKLGYEVIARYPEEDGRVILFQRGDVLAKHVASWKF